MVGFGGTDIFTTLTGSMAGIWDGKVGGLLNPAADWVVYCTRSPFFWAWDFTLRYNTPWLVGLLGMGWAGCWSHTRKSWTSDRRNSCFDIARISHPVGFGL